MSELNYRDVCQQIQQERPEGFKVNYIVVNFDKIGYEIQSNVLDRVCDRLENQAHHYLNQDVSIIRDNSINELWTYNIVHICGSSPLFNEQRNEYICPICKNKKTIFDF